MGTIHTGTTQKREPTADHSPADITEDGDLAVLDRDAPGNRVERRDWRGEGVVGRFHTD